MNYIEGQTVERWGSVYLVTKIYQISDEFIKEYNLNHKKRVTLQKISGENGPNIMDFALTQEKE